MPVTRGWHGGVTVMSESVMAKQWATRVVVAFQTVCWFSAILLLLYRGVTNLWSSPELTAPLALNHTTSGPGLPDRRHSLGVGLVIVATLMIAATPAIVLARIYDRRRYHTVNYQDRVDLGPPPQYEDVVSRAPSYSSLFDGANDDRRQEMTEM